MNEILEVKFEARSEGIVDVIEIWRFGKNDYAVNFVNNHCSVRGTLAEVMDELFSTFRPEDLEEVIEA